MTAREFLQSKEPNVFIIPEEWLEEYANIVLSVAAEKAKTEPYQNERLIDFSRMVINKGSIINCLKD